MKIKDFTYTKASGEASERSVLVVSAPKKNYLVVEVGGLNIEEVQSINNVFNEIEDFRREKMDSIKDLVTWKTFKPEGIKWHDS